MWTNGFRSKWRHRLTCNLSGVRKTGRRMYMYMYIYIGFASCSLRLLTDSKGRSTSVHTLFYFSGNMGLEWAVNIILNTEKGLFECTTSESAYGPLKPWQTHNSQLLSRDWSLLLTEDLSLSEAFRQHASRPPDVHLHTENSANFLYSYRAVSSQQRIWFELWGYPSRGFGFLWFPPVFPNYCVKPEYLPPFPGTNNSYLLIIFYLTVHNLGRRLHVINTVRTIEFAFPLCQFVNKKVVNSKGFWRECITLRINGFWTLCIVRYST
jgi:hypothetical protein